MATVNFIRYQKQSAGALIGVKRYVEQKEKTFDGEMQLVSGQNCTPQLADREFIATRNVHRKESPVWFYHYTQSFKPDEPVTGKTTHEIAKEFAARAWPDSEVLIATHIDAAHIHSHFIVNAVCFQTGKMLRQGPNTLKTLRQVSDQICQAHQLSVLPTRQKKQSKGMTGREYRVATKGRSWKFRLINTIDECMRYAKSRAEFISLMRSEGYEVRWTDTRKNITYTTPDGLKCRDDRLHEEKYRKEVMEREFAIRQAIVAGGIKAAQSFGEHANNSAANTASDGKGVGRSAAQGGQVAAPHTGTGGGTAGADGVVGGVSQQEADRGTDAGYGGVAGDASTGWERERAGVFAAEVPTAGDGLRSLQLAGGGHDAHGGDRVGDSLIRLGYHLERLQSDPVVTPRARGDSKALRREREQKIAHGQKPDDFADEQQTWQQTM